MDRAEGRCDWLQVIQARTAAHRTEARRRPYGHCRDHRRGRRLLYDHRRRDRYLRRQRTAEEAPPPARGGGETPGQVPAAVCPRGWLLTGLSLLPTPGAIPPSPTRLD